MKCLHFHTNFMKHTCAHSQLSAENLAMVKTLSFGLMARLNADSKGKSTDILHKSN